MMISYRLSDKMYVVKCDAPYCTLAMACRTSDEASALQTSHQCPHIKGESHYSWSVTVTLVEELWALMDEGYKRMLTGEGTEKEKAEAKGRLRGLAEATCIFMKPFFTHPDQIVREVVDRHNKGPEYETPGLGQRKFEAPPGTVHPQRESVTARPAVDDATLEAIKAGRAAGFT